MPQLDLYGTVDAAICCLDSLNYLTNPRDVQRTFERLHLFIAPGGTLIFDVNTPEKFLRLDGQVYLDAQQNNNRKGAVKTGDYQPVMMWIMLLLISGMAVVAVMLRKRNRA